MPVVQFLRGTVWKGEPRNPGDEVEVTDVEAFRLVHWGKAVRVDGKDMVVKASGMVTADVIQTRDPVAQHRDPVTEPAKRRK